MPFILPPPISSPLLPSARQWGGCLLLALALLSPLLPAATMDGEACAGEMRRGEHAAAAACWSRLLDHKGAAPEWQLQRAEAYRMVGQIDLARQDLLSLVAHRPEGVLRSRAQLALGRIALQRNQFEEAKRRVADALAGGGEAAAPWLVIAATQLQGDIALGLQATGEAESYYRQALSVAREAGESVAEVDLLLSLIALREASADTTTLLRQAQGMIAQLAPSARAGALALEAGIEARRLGERKSAFTLLSHSIGSARLLSHSRLLSRALGEMGALYESRGRLEEALSLTWEAIAEARGEIDADLLLQWEWQQGRIEKGRGNREVALDAHRRALSHLDRIRADMPVAYTDGRSSFRETLSPLYLGHVELLLAQADHSEGAEQQRLLDEAQVTMERFKSAEMQDYFKDACAANLSSLAALQGLIEHTAILYPILLPDRLEMLIQVGETRYHRSVEAPAGQIRQLAARLSRRLRPTGGALPPFSKALARRLYDILIGPIEPLLAAHQVDTLIYLPDGPLRKIPLDTLWDGERFLVERYAVAIAPGLTLLDPKPVSRKGMRALLAGISKPGRVVEDLPQPMQSALMLVDTHTPDRATRNAMRGITFRALPSASQSDPPPAQGDRPQGDRVDSGHLRDVLALPGVVGELDRVAETMPVERLQDDVFVLDRFASEMGKSYRIVHIASHGLFSGTPEESFIITYDRILDMNRLEALFKSEAFSSDPVEILTLSACQTAEGDDRSPLGLSGVAIKSGARSAVGSLWPVADDAAQILLPEFYRHLTLPDTTKAQALREAKRKLMEDPRFAHPSFWSPFILIGNWL